MPEDATSQQNPNPDFVHNPNASELEIILIKEKLINDFVLKPSDIQRVWKSPRMKDELVKFFQELYKPASQFEQEKVEYNQINILAEYQLYNIIYAKNELLFDDYKVSVVLDIFWKLLEFNPDDPNKRSQPPSER